MNTRNHFDQQVIDANLFKHRSLFGQIIRIVFRIAAFLFLFSIIIILVLRWVNPPTTSFILQWQFEARQQNEPISIQHRWTNWNNISSHLKMAAIASEDQRFATHWGLDLHSIQKAIDEYERGQDLRGASTITQQVAKNLFLWPEHSYIRKGIEAYTALLIELLWSKERILEVYLNIVEFGDGIYGAHAAAHRYFDTTAANLSKWESAFMVTALPAPKRYDLANPSEYMLQRSSWVMRYMDLLGNQQYLEQLK
jgi:monofunctional biosynthetic peptidoglycan transglycosylase